MKNIKKNCFLQIDKKIKMNFKIFILFYKYTQNIYFNYNSCYEFHSQEENRYKKDYSPKKILIYKQLNFLIYKKII